MNSSSKAGNVDDTVGDFLPHSLVMEDTENGISNTTAFCNQFQNELTAFRVKRCRRFINQ